jgi:hypothetical protein
LDYTGVFDSTWDNSAAVGRKLMATRKPVAGRPRKPSRAQAEAWRALHRQLAQAKTYRQVETVARQEPPPHAARYYSNLRHFLRTFAAPRGASRSERFVYRKLQLRFGGNGEKSKTLEGPAASGARRRAVKEKRDGR